MKKRMISWLIVVSMLFPFCFTAHAAEASTGTLETDVSDRIELMVSQFYSGRPGQYEIGTAIPIYNADTICIYYILPIFCDQECVGAIELNTSGDISLTDEVTLYNEVYELTVPAYLLYVSGGVVFAEFPDEVVELYNTRLAVPPSNDFVSLPYSDKAAEIEERLEAAETLLDTTAVVENVDIIISGISPLSVVPTLEVEQCSITNFVSQNGYNLCWAACVATIANYKRGLSLSAENVAIAMGHTNYADLNYLGANAAETANALSLYNLTYSVTSGKPSWANTKNYIIDDCPFIMGLITQVYNPSTSAYETAGHMLVGYGYHCAYGDDVTNSDSRYIYAWEPNGSQLYLQYHASNYSIGGYTFTWAETLID